MTDQHAELIEYVPDLDPIGDEEGVHVRGGDCVSSIAEAHGFFWETLWDHPRNKELKDGRKDPNVLVAGDRVFIPDLVPKHESRATDQRHTFKRRGVPEKLVIRLTNADGPRANLPYEFEIGRETRQGSTDGDGVVREWIPNGAKSAVLRISEREFYELDVGGLGPPDDNQGIRQRLLALGLSGSSDELGPLLIAFQSMRGLEVTGELDDETRAKLAEEFGR